MARLAKLSSKNQITLPMEILKNHPGAEYFSVADSADAITLTPVTLQATKRKSAVEEMRDQFEALGLGQKDIDDAVKWARKELKAGR